MNLNSLSSKSIHLLQLLNPRGANRGGAGESAPLHRKKFQHSFATIKENMQNKLTNFKNYF